MQSRAQIPSADLKKIYTEDSIRQLENVKASIRRNLPKGMQDVVDSYAEQLQEAFKKSRIFDRSNDLSFYQGNVTGTASSQETANEKTKQETHWIKMKTHSGIHNGQVLLNHIGI